MGKQTVMHGIVANNNVDQTSNLDLPTSVEHVTCNAWQSVPASDVEGQLRGSHLKGNPISLST